MSAKKRKAAPSATTRLPSEQTIAMRAYGRWQARGCPWGDGREDWFAAQAELLQEAPKPKARAKMQAGSLS
jgi:hypothetical protein